MNTVRVWILRIAAITAVIFGASLLYISSEDFSWGREALSESHYNESMLSGILAQADKKEDEGRSAMYAGLLLVSSAFLMDGLASVIRKLEKAPAKTSN